MRRSKLPRHILFTGLFFSLLLTSSSVGGPTQATDLNSLAEKSAAAIVYFPVKVDAFEQFSPDVSYDVDVDQYGTAFTDATQPDCTGQECTQNVTAVGLNANGGILLTQSVSATPNTDDKEPTIAANTKTGGYLVAYYVKDASNPPYCTVQVGNNVSIYRVRGNVYAKVYDRGGNLVAGPIDVSGTTANHNVRVRAAFDPITQRYLLVWETAPTENICTNIANAGNNLGQGLARSDWRVRARILNANGTFYSAVFNPSNRSNTVQQNPDVAANTVNGGWMVAWGDKRFIDDHTQSQTEASFGQLIDSNRSSPYRVFLDWDLIIGETDFQDRFPHIAYNADDNEWVATWYGARGAFDADQSGTIYAQRMRSDGFWLGCPGQCPLNVYNPLTSDSDGDGIRDGNGHPDVMYCAKTDKYWIGWQIDNMTIRYKPFGRTLSALANTVGVSNVKGPAFAQTCRPSDGRTIMLYEVFEFDSQGKMIDKDIRGRFIQ